MPGSQRPGTMAPKDNPMAPTFGTSGLRGLVTELTDTLVADHVRAFLTACDGGQKLYVGRDLRASSPHLAGVICDTARAMGVAVIDCGALPTPALALTARETNAGAIMVTGSHIPDDRNGLKFYSAAGEITKADETAIAAALGAPVPNMPRAGSLTTDTTATARFQGRYLQAFGPGALAGARVGVWSHSSVGRDLLIGLLRDLGATVTEMGRSDSFIPVDTEAVDAATRAQLRDWAAPGDLDAIVSTDGDADRPLLTDAAGHIVPGDVLGQITAQVLGADLLVTPVSSNSGAELGGARTVMRTRIGSPYVIAAMKEHTDHRAVGYEANGGFILGFDAMLAGPLAALMTRDCVLPILATLVAARDGTGHIDVAARVAAEPARFTATDRIAQMPLSSSAEILAGLQDNEAARKALLRTLGMVESHICNTIDGLRMITPGGILHLRPSGNAPEFRIYVEAESQAKAQEYLARALAHYQNGDRGGSDR